MNLDPRHIEAWRIAREFPAPSEIANLCDFAQSVVGQLMESEFKRTNHPDDPKHKWQPADWHEEAGKVLRGEK